MTRRWGLQLGLLMLVGGLTSAALGAQTPTESPTALAVVEEGTVSRALAVTLIQGQSGVRILVDGLAFGDATAWTWQGRDLGGALDAALADGTASVQETPAGFEVAWNDPPADLRLAEADRLEVEAAGLGVQAAAAAPTPCPVRRVARPREFARVLLRPGGLGRATPFCAPVRPAPVRGFGTTSPQGGPSACATPLREWLDGASGCALHTASAASGLSPLRHCGGTPRPAPTGGRPHCPCRPDSIAFGAATAPTLAPDPACGYGSAACKGIARRHTGIDYPGTGNAVAIALGKVVRVETLSAVDRGMGNNVIVRHVLPGPNCAVVYSTYSHLAAVDPAIAVGAAVAKGQTLGAIGRSGFGNPSYWPAAHLHLEIKSRAVVGNPLSAGTQTKTCAADPLNATANSCVRYVATATSPATVPDDYGYLAPGLFLNKTLPVPVYRQLSAGGNHTCALKADNTLACWGDNGYGQASPVAGSFKQVSAGNWHTCGIKADNTLACWGNNSWYQRVPPRGSFKQVSVRAYFSCGLKADNTLACWGDASYGQVSPPAGSFQQVSAGFWHACALKADNSLACWGNNGYGQASPPGGAFKQASAGAYHTCAVKADNTLTCWGNNGYGQASPPGGTFKQVSAGSDYACGLKADNSLACWGRNDSGQASPPAGSFKQLSAGADNTCAVRADNTLACWGKNEVGETSPPVGTHKEISSGGMTELHTGYACGLKADNTLTCWGGNSNGEATPLVGSFKQVSSGGAHTCGLKADNTLACWGNDTYGQASPPSGSFKQVSAGDGWYDSYAPGAHTCGLKADNTIICWGYNSDGQSSPPAGSFKQVSAGGHHTCGLKADGTLACWGRNMGGEASPPVGIFKQVSA